MTTEEMLEEIEERGVVKIEMTERGVEFLNENNLTYPQARKAHYPLCRLVFHL